MREIIAFLTAGSFVYLALKIKDGYGDPAYYCLVIACLVAGYMIGGK